MLRMTGRLRITPGGPQLTTGLSSVWQPASGNLHQVGRDRELLVTCCGGKITLQMELVTIASYSIGNVTAVYVFPLLHL